MSDTFEWDDIVIGGGSSGAVLASRLSEDPQRRVLLLEAGPDFAGLSDLPEVLRSAHAPVMSGYNWDYMATVRGGGLARGFKQSVAMLAASPRDMMSAARAALQAPAPLSSTLQQLPYFPGKVIGGSSSVNGAVALRPSPSDFAAWHALGCEGWSWDDVLPFYKKLESDRDFDNVLHGASGPLPVLRARPHELDSVQAAFRAACIKTLGLPDVPDLNGGDTHAGVGLLPGNAPDGVRYSTALAYLASARSRANLRVQGDCLADKLLFDGRRVVGVQVLRNGRVETYRGARVTVCAGALNTVGVLMRSGIGHAEQCRAIGVPSVAHLPGVGENLMDHPAIVMWMVPRDGEPVGGLAQHQVMARVATQGETLPDLNLFILNSFETTRIPMLSQLLGTSHAHSLSVVLARPRSRGCVRINSAAPDAKPLIDLDLGADSQDLDKLAQGVRLAWQLIQSEPLAARTRSVFLWTQAMMRNDGLLRSAITRFLNATWHACGTARMGAATDPMAVLDAQFRVHTLEGLRVVDASVLPQIPSVPTNLTCIMLAERAAQWMRAERP